MSADDRDVISQGQKLFSDRLEQLPLIASGEIGTADRAGEQHVTDDRQTLRRTEKDDASRRMPRTMQDLERQLSNLHLISIFQPSVRLHVRGVPDAEGASAVGDVLQQKQIVPVGPLDRYVEVRL